MSVAGSRRTSDDGYYDALSEGSKRSSKLQGGIHAPDDAASFIAKPHAHDAVRVRLWDELAKVADAQTPSLDHRVSDLEAARRRAV